MANEGNYFEEAAAVMEKTIWYRGSAHPNKSERTSNCLWTAVAAAWSEHGCTTYATDIALDQAILGAIKLIDPEWQSEKGGPREAIEWNDRRAKRKKDAVAVLRKAGELYTP
jgi:hypothetical protein